MRLRERIDRARRLTRREWRDLALAHLALLAAWRDVRMRDRGLAHRRARQEGDGSPGTSGCSPRDFLQRGRAQQLALAVERAVEYGPLRVPCLVAALALRRLLEREGLDGGVVRVGVRSDGTGFVAHAWVEFRGVAFLHPPHSADAFTPLPGVDVFPDR